VPQRADVDNFYGRAVESGFVTVTQHDPNASLIDLFLDQKKQRQYQPKLFYEGQELGYYFPSSHEQVPSHHSPVEIKGKDGETLKSLAFKIDREQTAKMPDRPEIIIEINKDFVPALLGSALKAAHLTMFYHFQYEWLNLAAGKDLAIILAKFFREQHDNTENLAEETAKYFGAPLIKQMVKPFIPVGGFDLLSGTLLDKRCIAFIDSNDTAFVFGVVVKAKDHLFMVFVPAEYETINTYFDFLKCPATSVAMHIVEWTGDAWKQIHVGRMAYKANE
jgi:hypothetical protein